MFISFLAFLGLSPVFGFVFVVVLVLQWLTALTAERNREAKRSAKKMNEHRRQIL